MRKLVFVISSVACASAALAQDPAPPATWKVRTDAPRANAAELYYVAMPPGWHITSGPAAVYWDPSWTAQGDYALEAEIFQFPTRRVREAFGIFLGGSDLEGPAQAYLYFLIRGDGRFLVKRRTGARTENVLPWTSHDAIAPRDAGDGTVKNVLRVEVAGSRIRFLVNGTEVAGIPRGDLPTAGIAGLRVNHGLNLHVSRFEIEF